MNQLSNENLAFLFQGVGSEYQKFLYLLGEEEKERLEKYCSIVNKEIKLDLWNYLFNCSLEKYDKLFSDWIAIYTCDYIVYESYINFNIKPKILAGYSMGLITAMACGRSISFEDGLHMLLNIYEYPKHSSRKEEAMAVIIGMNFKEVENIIKKNNLNEEVDIASENSEYCIVISGIKSSIIKVMKIAEDEGAIKVKKIEVPYAFHSHYAENGIETYIELVNKISVKDSITPIISVFNQEILQNAFDLKKELIRNMSGRMYWKKSVEKIINMGISSFVEVSLDNSLTKISKLINSDCEFLTYKKLLKQRCKIEAN